MKEFGGEKEFTRAFLKTDQCKKNCSWISGESSAAFSFLVGTLILKHPLFFFINLFFGLVVSFCRISMGGHFLSDNLFEIYRIHPSGIKRIIKYSWFEEMFIASNIICINKKFFK